MTLKRQISKKKSKNLSPKIKKGGWGGPIELPNSRQQGGSRKKKIQTGGKWSNSKVSWFGLF
jgi:hypothetical protein